MSNDPPTWTGGSSHVSGMNSIINFEVHEFWFVFTSDITNAEYEAEDLNDFIFNFDYLAYNWTHGCQSRRSAEASVPARFE